MAAVGSGTTSAGRVTYLSAGDANPVPIVFLHGIGGGARLWTHQVGAFGERYRAIAWDMPGYGGSAPLDPMTIDRLAAALAAFVEELGLDRPILAGHSIGGMVVQSYLADGLGPVRAAVLAQTSAAFGGRDPAWAESFVAERLGPLDRGASMASLAPAIVADLLGDDPDPAGVALAESCVADVPEATWRASVRALPGFDRREALPRIAVPTLFLAGSKDRNAPAPTMQRMADRIPLASYACLEGVGHLANVERPADFDAALAAFLEAHAPPGAAR